MRGKGGRHLYSTKEREAGALHDIGNLAFASFIPEHSGLVCPSSTSVVFFSSVGKAIYEELEHAAQSTPW